MYTQARYFIRTALIYLVAAFAVGGVVLLNQALAIDGGEGTGLSWSRQALK